jgi:hypothetical protein
MVKPNITIEINEILNATKVGHLTGSVSFKRFSFHRSESHEEPTGRGLSQITVALINKYLAKAICQSLKDRLSFGSPPPSLDFYANSLDMIELQTIDPNYVDNGGLAKLQLLKQTKLYVVHGRYHKLFFYFESHYDNMERFL